MPELEDWEEWGEGIEVGIVGLGKMGLLHSGLLNLLYPRSVSCIVEKDFLISLAASLLFKKVKIYRDVERMLQDSPGVVYITTPVRSHFSLVETVLNSGVRGVFVEKPPTANSRELQRLLSKAGGRQVMVGLQKRLALPFRLAGLFLSQDVIGDVEAVKGYIRSGDVLAPTERYKPLGRGVLLDLGVHLVDLLVWLFQPSRVESAKFRSEYSGVDDAFRVAMSTRSGTLIRMEASWSVPTYRSPQTYLEVAGSRGRLRATEDSLLVDASRPHELLGGRRKLEMYRPHLYQGLPPANLADPEYTLEEVHFLYSLQQGTEPLTSLSRTARTMELIDEMYSKAGAAS